jgi:thiamine-phosphate pyrophosphorylase
VLRLIDANANRAREALRVLEDAARFVLGDADAASGLKQTRHELRAALDSAGLDATRLAAWRDTPGDVGTGLNTAAESERADLRAVCVAAGKRAGEALRALEETVKTVPGGEAPAARIKARRYRVYDLEKRVVLGLGGGRGRQWRLCVLVSEGLCRHHDWLEVARRAADGGADCVQLREKTMDAGELLRRARALVGAMRGRGGGVSVVVNDRPDVALCAGADGVHLGQDDLPLEDARRLAGAGLSIGVSTSGLGQAVAAAAGGADVCGVGPMFATSTKHKPVLAGVEYLRAYLGDDRTRRVPHLAIGGVNRETAYELARAGARGVAVSSAVCGAGRPERACAEILEAMERGWTDVDARRAADAG